MKSVVVLLGAVVMVATSHSAAAQYTTNPRAQPPHSVATLSAKLIDQQKKAMQQAATVDVSVAGVTLVDPAATGEIPAAGQGHLHYQVDNGPTVATPATKLSFHGLTPGTHTIKVMLADNAHNPIGPQQTLNVTIGTQTTSMTGQPSYPTKSQPTTQTQASAQAQSTSTTIAGCVYRERDVPGRTPNVSEQAGILEDYILADIRTTGHQPTTPAGATAGATGTAGSSAAAMYKLEHVADERLRALVGKRVEVTGRIDAERGDTRTRAMGTTSTPSPQRDQSVGPDRIELPEFEVMSMREVAGTCPATPSMPRR